MAVAKASNLILFSKKPVFLYVYDFRLTSWYLMTNLGMDCSLKKTLYLTGRISLLAVVIYIVGPQQIYFFCVGKAIFVCLVQVLFSQICY